ncbi:DegT/DnrJ/EryC1/StrS family aminotransferase [Bradyrhizobium japonicum]|uniref:DegT/DnrJ/EryC1/StrS family aminotransferase n=1 Tax=Bradyrhizobium japonicum TaxID=375 RepID=UPI00048957BE|nr:DegT/DnrJ/EryC1/StrS family aminotransferase [Bradyrhizobium japonicum]
MIPVFEPMIGDTEIAYVTDALRRGEISGNFGTYLDRFEQGFAAYCGCKHGIAVTSGTTALHLAVDAVGIGSGDEVLISASTNIATALGVYHNNAMPVPVDSENVTWNLDLNLLESLITPHTKAIIPVHLFGHPVDMDQLMDIARRHGLFVIEDCAESHGATVRGRMTGSFGDMACYSFYANKVITTGEGGMVVTNDDRLAERLRLLRNLGFTKPRFRHDVAGYNFRMTSYQAAMGLAQLEKIDTIIGKKRRVAAKYNELLAEVPGLRLPLELNWAKNVYWMYAVTVEPEFGLSRDELASRLAQANIETRTFFCPMNRQPVLRKLPGFRLDDCPVADRLWETGLYLPSSPTLSDEKLELVRDAIVAARN